MYWRNRRLRSEAVVVVAMLGMVGCATPPAVGPLLGVVDKALAQEARLVEEDGAWQGEMLKQTRESLGAGFEADVRERGTLEAEWVLEATRAYAAAVEAVGRHEARLAEQRRVRGENLAVAREAQKRAVTLLEEQDRLLGRMGLDLWQLEKRMAGKETER